MIQEGISALNIKSFIVLIKLFYLKIDINCQVTPEIE